MADITDKDMAESFEAVRMIKTIYRIQQLLANSKGKWVQDNASFVKIKSTLLSPRQPWSYGSIKTQAQIAQSATLQTRTFGRCEEGTATECLPMIMTYTSIKSLKEVIAESSGNPGKMVGENKKIAMHSILTASIHAQLMQHIWHTICMLTMGAIIFYRKITI
jgi:hypothetical protein